MSEPDWIEQRLSAHVAQVVKGLSATRRRRCEIAEELLSHLLGVADEEFARCGDEARAVDRATRRLGRVEHLASQIQASVPWWERTACSFLNLWEVVMWRWLLAVGVAAVLIGLGFVFPAIAPWRMHGHLLAAQIGFLSLGLAITLSGAVSLAVGVKRWLMRAA